MITLVILLVFRKNMDIRTKYVLLLVTFAVADKQVKLEDIERDNLLSERRVNREEETVKIGHTQYLTGAIHVGPSGEASFKKCSSLKLSVVIMRRELVLGIVRKCGK